MRLELDTNLATDVFHPLQLFSRHPMNRRQAQLQLCAYRPNGADAADPELFEALQMARQDPELAAWFADQLSFDACVADQLRAAVPPASLREQLVAILYSRVLRVDLSREPIGRRPVPPAGILPSSLDGPAIQS